MNKMIAALLIAVSVSSAQAAKYVIDKEHSSISFKVRHLASRVPGSFTDFSGTFEFDEKNPKKASAEAVIQVDSINTRNAKRDGHLKSADFFDAAKYPTATFKATKLAAEGEGKWKLTGMLNLHGVEKPVTLDVEYAGEAKSPQGKTLAGFSAKGTINRKDFGIVYNSTLETGGLMLGEDVDLDIEIEAIKQ